jgi:hypothetical protein
MISPELLAWSHLKRDGMRSTRRPPTRFLSALLHRNLAYHVDVMPEHRAQWR